MVFPARPRIREWFQNALVPLADRPSSYGASARQIRVERKVQAVIRRRPLHIGSRHAHLGRNLRQSIREQIHLVQRPAAVQNENGVIVLVVCELDGAGEVGRAGWRGSGQGLEPAAGLDRAGAKADVLATCCEGRRDVLRLQKAVATTQSVEKNRLELIETDGIILSC